jgi:hypothetical protein
MLYQLDCHAESAFSSSKQRDIAHLKVGQQGKT